MEGGQISLRGSDPIPIFHFNKKVTRKYDLNKIFKQKSFLEIKSDKTRKLKWKN